MRIINSVINVHKTKNIKSEVATQLLYGDTFKKLKRIGPWIIIKSDTDNYRGFIKKKKFTSNQKNTHKVFSLSGGLDTSTLASVYANQGNKVNTVSFVYK